MLDLVFFFFVFEKELRLVRLVQVRRWMGRVPWVCDCRHGSMALDIGDCRVL